MAIARQEAQVNAEENNPQLAEKIFSITGAVCGFATGIYGAVRLTHNDLSSMPMASLKLANQSFPLGFYRGVSIFLTAGTFCNFFSHYGKTVDIVINGVKTFPYHGTKQEMIDWIKASDSKNTFHVVGTVLGTVVSGVFIYNSATQSFAHFVLPFNAQKDIPEPVLMITSVVYIPGAFANTFSYFSFGTREAVRLGSTIYEKVMPLLPRFSFFNREQPAQANVAEPQPQPAPQV